MIELDNKKLHNYIVMKDEIVDEGRAISKEIERLDKKIISFEEKEKAITLKVEADPELKAEGDKLIEVFNGALKRLEEIGNLIQDKKREAIPKEMELEHKEAMKQKEKLERDRNKIALKVQKIKDKIIPLVQKEVKPLIQKENNETVDFGKFDDIETAQVKNGKVHIKTFNHLKDYMSKFKR